MDLTLKDQGSSSDGCDELKGKLLVGEQVAAAIEGTVL
jgi:hypothetical protein